MYMYLSRGVLCLQINDPYRWSNVTKNECSFPQLKYKIVK